MPDAASPPAVPENLRTLIRQLGADTLDVHRTVFTEPGLLPGTLNADAEALCQDRAAARSALHDLLPDEDPPTAQLFYGRLEKLSVLLIHCPSRAELLGIFLSESYHLWPAAGEPLLRGLNGNEHNAFFTVLPSLPTFLSENELSAELASAWFVETLDRLGNDLASGGFWDGLRTFARHFPERALEVTARLCRQREASENALSVAANLLGVCRGIPTTGRVAGLLAAHDAEFGNNRRPSVRVCFQRSWIPTAHERALAPHELATLLVTMGEGTENEHINAFQVVTSCLLSEKTEARTRTIGLDWLRQQATPTSPPLGKHQVVRFALLQKSSDNDALLLAVQPIVPEHSGTWNLLIQILGQRLRDGGLDAFQQLLTNLALAGGQDFLKGFTTHGITDSLLSELASRDHGGLLADSLFSTSPLLRELGFFFFEKLPAPTVPAEVLAGKTDTELLLSLLELRGGALLTHGKTVADYLLAVAPRMEQAGEELRAEFAQELLVQAKNYPGACLKRFKSAAADGPPLLADAVAKADAYFDALRTLHKSPLTALHVPGMDRARRQHSRQFSHKVEKQSEEKSVLAQLFKTVHLLYGDQFAFNQGGAIEPQPFQQISMEWEMPRLEFIYPESMLLRRLQAKTQIAHLQESLVAPFDPPPHPDPAA